jgi:hypothetical protein
VHITSQNKNHKPHTLPAGGTTSCTGTTPSMVWYRGAEGHTPLHHCTHAMEGYERKGWGRKEGREEVRTG